MALLLPLFLALSVRAADGVWTGGAGTWTDTSKWLDEIVPGAGDAAAFTGAGGTVTVPPAAPFTLSALLFNTNGVSVAWTIGGNSTNMLAYPAVIRVDTNEATLASALVGTAGLQKVGAGTLNLDNMNNATLFSGPVRVAGGGVLRSRGDESLGAVPAPDDTYTPPDSALTFDDGGLASWGVPLTLNPGRGITVNAGGMWFIARSTLGIGIPSKITGAGSVRVARESSAVTFSNTANNYAGDTVLGSKDNGYGTAGIGRLVLGADEVIPDGPGKGVLRFAGDRRGALDLNGHSETVNSLDAPGGFILSNGAAAPGVLTAGADNADLRAAGDIGGGATLVKTGSGALIYSGTTASTGTLRVAQGPLVFSSGDQLGRVTLALDGGSLRVADSIPGLTEGKAGGSSITPGAALTFNNVTLAADKGVNGILASEFGENVQFSYTGVWHVDAADAGLYSFAKSFDDQAALVLDGQTLIDSRTYANFPVVQDVPVSAGDHTVELRFFNGTGGVGPRPELPLPYGIAFDPDNGDFTDLSNARGFIDPGDGSVLRTAPLGTATNTVRARLELAQSGTLDRSGAAASPLVWGNDLVARAAGAALTVTGGDGPFLFGAPAGSLSAVFDADVIDPHGVVFQSLAWIKSWPGSSAHTVLPGSELAAGAPGVLGTGALTLTDRNIRIPSADTLIEGVAVADGRVVRFDATRETGGRLYDDPDYAFTADNDVTLLGGSAAIAFAGQGSITYAGTVSGTGRLVKNGYGTVTLTQPSTFEGTVQIGQGRLLISDDTQLGHPTNGITVQALGVLAVADGAALTTGRALTAQSGGRLDIPADASVTLTGTLSGTLAKTGAGGLALGGADANASLDLTVDEGVVTLDKDGGPAVRNVVSIASNAVLRLAGAGGNQISGGVSVTGGTFDLNGRSEGIGTLSGLAAQGGAVVNNGASPATLTVGEGNAMGSFRGTFADGTAPLALTQTGNNALWLTGGLVPMAYTGPTTVASGGLNWGTPARYLRLTVTRTRTAGSAPGISEFRALLNGEWVRAAVTASVSSQNGATGGADRLVDNDTQTKWQAANGNAGAWIKLDFGKGVAMDGYAWYTRNDGANSDPVSWRVEISRDNAAWHTVDERADVGITQTRQVLAGAWPFRDPYAGGFAASAGSAVTVAAGATATLNTPRETVAALAGAGTVTLQDGVTLRTGDVSGFTGGITGAGRIELTGAGGDTPLAANAAPGVTFVNAASAPRAAVISGGAFGASLADGAAPLGLTKRGPGTTVLRGSASAYTGDTRIEAGTLSVVPGSTRYRYVKFTVTQIRDPLNSSGGNRMSLGEFQLTRDGDPVALPAGTVASALTIHSAPFDASHAIDGDWNNSSGRFIGGVGIPNWLMLDMQEPVVFDGYQFYTATDSGFDPYRDPISWTFEGSDDGAAWTLLDSQADATYANQRKLKVGPFTVASAPVPVPPEFWAVTNGCADAVGAVAARYLRFTPMRTRPDGDGAGSGFQFGELELRLDGATVPYPEGTVATAPGGGFTDSIQALLEDKACDNILPTANNNNRWYSASLVNPLTVDMGAPVAFNGYRLWTAYNGAGRDPVSWTLEISADGVNWYEADTQTNQLYAATRYAAAGEWQLKLPARDGRLSCAIPDISRTHVAAGATLRLDGVAETVGPLSGAGAVELAEGAVLGVNLFEDAVFGGVFTGTGGGPGTLALAGDHAQFFTGADAAPGDLAVDFRGGRFGGTLHIGGALTVSGPVAYAQPAAFPARVTLFTFGSIDADSRAALIAGAASVAAPSGMVAKVTVSDDTAVLSVNSPGTVLLVR